VAATFDECLFLHKGKGISTDDCRELLNKGLEKFFMGKAITVSIYRQLMSAIIRHHLPQYYNSMQAYFEEDNDDTPLPDAQSDHSPSVAISHYGSTRNTIPGHASFHMELFYNFTKDLHKKFFLFEQVQGISSCIVFKVVFQYLISFYYFDHPLNSIL
jgi:hypothetical protein